jgi:hypothetical protein
VCYNLYNKIRKENYSDMKIVKLTLIFISLVLIGQLVLPTSHAKIDPQTIVGIWLLDEGKGDIVKDLSKNGDNGKVVDAKWVQGKFGNALEFDGVSHVEIPATDATDDYVDGFTYLLWVMPTAAPPNANTRVIERDWHNPTIQIGASDFYGSTVIKGIQDASNVRGGTWAQGEWSFVALSWDGSTLSLYVDGKMVKDSKLAKPDFTKNNSGGSIWLAQWKGAAGWDFKGVIDEVGIFNVALSEDDIKGIMNNGLDKALGMSPVSNEGKLTSTWGYIKG